MERTCAPQVNIRPPSASEPLQTRRTCEARPCRRSRKRTDLGTLIFGTALCAGTPGALEAYTCFQPFHQADYSGALVCGIRWVTGHELPCGSGAALSNDFAPAPIAVVQVGGGGMVSNHRLVLFTHALCRLSYPAVPTLIQERDNPASEMPLRGGVSWPWLGSLGHGGHTPGSDWVTRLNAVCSPAPAARGATRYSTH
jgi:hypothetical protein